MNAVLAGVKNIEHGSIQTKDTVKAMSESGVFHIPTLKAAWGIIQAGDSAGIPEYAMAKAKEMGEYPSKSLILSFRAGVKVASGTDAGTPFNRHGDNAKELELMVDAGLTPMDAIVCTTKNGAEVCGLSKRLGTIETGKLADIIVVNGDPSKEIRLLQNKQNIMLVMKDGIIEVNRGL
jgi:imidazolonepropionase-like amidohydrolase